MSRRENLLWTSALFLLCSSACVQSNLDNAFDPQFPLGFAIGFSLSSSAGSTDSATSATTNPVASVCNRTTTLSFWGEGQTGGANPVTISAGAAEVEILVIGGGGGGGTIDVARDGVTTTSLDGFTGGTSYVEIAGGATLVSATGGSGGIHSQGANGGFDPAVTGTGGAGGTPNGVAGGAAPYATGNGTVGALTDYAAGKGGLSAAGGSFGWTWFGGGSGGSGGLNTLTRTDLAGVNLNVYVGAGGARGTSADGFSQAGDGGDGYVQILTSDVATVSPCDAYAPFVKTYGYGLSGAGVYSYTVPADARVLEIFAIGGGGGGGTIDVARDGVTSTQLNGFSGGDTTVAINGGATFLTAGGGAGGTAGQGSVTTYAPATQGLGGAGGSASGVNGSDAPINSGNASGGSLTNYIAGTGGTGASAGAIFGGWYGGGGGGSGGTATATRTDLAGQTLDITIGAGGATGNSADGDWGVTAGTDGFVYILVY